MDFNGVMRTLESSGTAQSRKIYKRHGAKEPMFGVSFAVLRKLQKQIKTDHELARRLWETGNYDARILAAMIADPVQVDEALADAWVRDLDCYTVTDQFAGLVANSKLAKSKGEQWATSGSEYVARTGWHILSSLADEPSLSDSFFATYLSTIEKEIHARPNRTREAMNNALINFGLRAGLTQKALEAATRIGVVDVDHGQTNCKTPDAATYIQKTLAYREKKKKAKAA